MRLLLSLVLFACFEAASAGSSQKEDSAALKAMFRDPEIVDSKYGDHSLELDGCQATLIWDHHLSRFLMSSVDYRLSEQRVKDHSFMLNEDALRQYYAWVGIEGFRTKLRSFPDGVLTGDETPEEEKKATEWLEREIKSTIEGLLSGEFGPWFQRHHYMSADRSFRFNLHPQPFVRLRIREQHRQSVIDAMRSYTEKYCLPAPDFSCTPFFVDAPGTVC